MTPFEKRILSYMEQRGGEVHRTDAVCDLASPNSRIGRGTINGSNGGIPRIWGAWTKRLAAQGYIVQIRDRVGYYGGHRLTEAGRTALREAK